MANLLRQFEKAALRIGKEKLPDYSEYRYDPVGFINDICKVKLVPQQIEVCNALLQPPRRLIVRSGHSIGKTYVCGLLVDWFTATRDPGICVVTAPTQRQLVDVTFKEIRTHMPLPLKQYFSPRATQWYHHERHKITGYTAEDSASFQGIHETSIFCVVDEMLGISAEIIEAIRGICSGGEDVFILMIGNPTDTSTPAYAEEQTGLWNVREMSALNHPNITAELKGEPAIIPSAVRLEQLRMNMKSWFQEVDLYDHETSEYGWTDIFFDGKIFRPGPEGDARVLGRWPQLSSYAIFSEHDFKMALESKTESTITDQIVISTDVSRYGNDWTTIFVRKGLVVIHHETFQGQSLERTFKRLVDLCHQYGGYRPDLISVVVDDCGIGGALTDFGKAQKYNFIGINAANTALNEHEYNNKRSELLFNLRDLIRSGKLNLSKLQKSVFDELKRQSLGILYSLDRKGRRVAEEKKNTKARLGRSPDDLDALALSVYPLTTGNWEYQPIQITKKPFEQIVKDSKNPLFKDKNDRDRDRVGWNKVI